jgi:hypothetical protein
MGKSRKIQEKSGKSRKSQEKSSEKFIKMKK